MSAWSRGLLSVSMVSAIPMLAMVALASRQVLIERYVVHLVPVAVGALLGAAAFHLIPEALRLAPMQSTLLVVGAGVLAFWLVDRWTSHAVTETPRLTGRDSGGGLRKHLPSAMLGDALHNVVDGVMVASAFIDRPSLGILAGAAVALHELPRELGTFALMIRAGVSPKRAILFNVLTGAAAIVGAAVTLAIGMRSEGVGRWLLPIAGGNFLYLAVSIGVLEYQASRRSGGGGRRVLLGLLGLVLSVAGLRGH